MKLTILFENEHFIVLSKPSGLLSVPDRKQSEPSLKDILRTKYGEIYTVHRLDKNTSGLIVYAKNTETHKQLSHLFEAREVVKMYTGMVNGVLQPMEGIVEIPIIEHPAKKGTMTTNAKGKPSKTGYQTIETFKDYSLVKFQLFTGRTHQIRVHAQYLGHPLICDELYGDAKPLFLSSIKKKYNLSKDVLDERALMPRLALHASNVAFSLNGEEYAFEAPLPKEFTATLAQLRKNNKTEKSHYL